MYDDGISLIKILIQVIYPVTHMTGIFFCQKGSSGGLLPCIGQKGKE